MRDVFHDEMQIEIHDMSQPLTTLRLRLELAMLQQDRQVPGCEGLREAVEGGLLDLQRIFDSVDRMRSKLMAEMGRQRPSQG